MSSRIISHWIALSIFVFTVALAGSARVSASPAASDSSAVSASPTDSTAVTPAPAESKEEPAVKEETKETKEKADAAKKSAKKKTKAAAATKGTVKKMEAKAASGTMPVKPAVMPQHVQVQHILIGFTGSVPGKALTRSKDDAKKLAYEILEQARKGDDFDELVKKYTDDSPPGIYGMSGAGVAPAPGEYARDSMVAAFGNVGFSISPGNIGIADFDATASPFGWHIIKRLK